MKNKQKAVLSLAVSLIFTAAAAALFYFTFCNIFYRTDGKNPPINPGESTVQNGKSASLMLCNMFSDNTNIKEHILFGKSIYADGDSVSAGDGSDHYAYAEFIRDRNNMRLVNRSKGGTTLALRDDRSDSIYERIRELDGEYDYLLIEGGYNDVFRGLSLGSPTHSRSSEDFDLHTIYGATDEICRILQTKYHDTKKLFVLGHKMKDEYEIPQQNAWNAIKETLNKWGIPYIDIYEETGLTSDEYDREYQVFNQDDGIHPTKKAYEKFYVPVIEEKLKSL